MSHCTISIQTADGRQAFAPGDDVPVVVKLQTRRAFDCRGLDLQLGFETHGKGNRDRKWFAPLTVHVGRVEEGVSEFEGILELPALSAQQPPTFLGHFINVDWFVRARVDVAWAVDPKETLRIDVDPLHAPASFEPPPVPPLEDVKLSGMSPGFLVVAALFIAAGVYFAAERSPWVAAALLVPPALIVSRFLRDRGAARRVGAVGFGVWPEPATVEGEVRAYVSLSPPGDLDLERVRVSLQAEERATSGSGTNTTTHTHLAVDLSETLLEERSIDGFEAWESEANFQIPADAPSTFDVGDNQVVWTALLEVVPRGSKPLRSSRVLQVGFE